MANLTRADSTIWSLKMMPLLFFTILALASSLAAAAVPQAWYLMAPDEKTLSNPRVAVTLERGPVVGPLEFTTRAQFSSRAECEPARQKLIRHWWQLSVIKRGTWDKYGFTSPSAFVRCVRGDDPQLKNSQAASGLPTLETFVNRPFPRR